MLLASSYSPQSKKDNFGHVFLYLMGSFQVFALLMTTQPSPKAFPFQPLRALLSNFHAFDLKGFKTPFKRNEQRNEIFGGKAREFGCKRASRV